jgi:hypothetical protein
MLSGCFKGYILNRYCSYDVVGNRYKFIHCDFTNKVGILIVTLTMGATFVTTFSPRSNVGLSFESKTLGWHFKTNLIKVIGHCIEGWSNHNDLNILIHSCLIFILLLLIPFKVSSNNNSCKNLEQLNLWSFKYMAGLQRVLFWFLFMVWGLMTCMPYPFLQSSTHNMYSWLKLTTLENLQCFWLRMLAILCLVNNSFWQNFQPLLSIMCLMFADVKRLVEVHNKHIERQDFAMNFEVCKKTFIFICLLKILLCKFTYEISNLVVFIYFYYNNSSWIIWLNVSL